MIGDLLGVGQRKATCGPERCLSPSPADKEPRLSISPGPSQSTEGRMRLRSGPGAQETCLRRQADRCLLDSILGAFDVCSLPRLFSSPCLQPLETGRASLGDFLCCWVCSLSSGSPLCWNLVHRKSAFRGREPCVEHKTRGCLWGADWDSQGISDCSYGAGDRIIWVSARADKLRQKPVGAKSRPMLRSTGAPSLQLEKPSAFLYQLSLQPYCLRELQKEEGISATSLGHPTLLMVTFPCLTLLSLFLLSFSLPPPPPLPGLNLDWREWAEKSVC